jgi:endonuclease/exonuclease/phosphatase family metal-dependent hydrolase
LIGIGLGFLRKEPTLDVMCRAFLLLLCVLGLASTAPAEEIRPLRVVAWNIEWFPGKSIDPLPEQEKEQIAAVRAAIRELDPDILLCSEIRNWAAFEEVVRAVPGLRIHAVSAYPSSSDGSLSRQQLAVASRLECVAAWAESFAPTIPTIPRGFAFAALRMPDSPQLLLVYSLHLKSNRSRDEAEAQLNFRMRDESVRQVLHHIETMERVMFASEGVRGVIVGGDINTNEDGQFGDRVVEDFVAAGFWNTWQSVPRDKRLTWRGGEQFEPTTFDYIFTKGLGRPVARMGGTPEVTSDHDAVVLEINLPLPLPTATP